MRMTLLSCVLFLGACGGEGGDWDATVDAFAAVACAAEGECFNTNVETCEDDVREDLAQARDELDDAGEAQCLACLEAKRAQAEVLRDTCDPDALDEQAVYDACDLDPATDYDGDSAADNDDDEACAGFP